jgi:hypothetical protein
MFQNIKVMDKYIKSYCVYRGAPLPLIHLRYRIRKTPIISCWGYLWRASHSLDCSIWIFLLNGRDRSCQITVLLYKLIQWSILKLCAYLHYITKSKPSQLGRPSYNAPLESLSDVKFLIRYYIGKGMS